MTFRHATGLLLVAFAPFLGPTARGQVAAPLSAEITIREIPAQLETGGSATALVDVRNTGTQTWHAQGDVRLAYHWLNALGGLVLRDGERTRLPVTVRPGETVQLCATLVAPGTPGAYQVEWEMVREGVGWFAAGNGSDRRRAIAISSGPGKPDHPSIPLLVFFAVTLGHFFMTSLWMRQARWTIGATRDEQLFAGVVVGLGSLMAVLHAIACTIGLSMPSVAAAVIVGHLVIGLLAIRASRSPSPKREPPGEGPGVESQSSPAEAIFEWVGMIVLVAIGVHWFATAAASMAVVGTDAEHYHVPNAINLALGANPLNFVATPHLYPMGTSVLAAWFILPLNDPLLIDLALVLPFLLAFSALAVLFRRVANASGLAWVPWFILPLFATPMLQISSLMSADLMYAAAFLATNTQLFRMWRERAASFADLVMAALAMGMLVGSKTTGAVSAALLLSTYGLLVLLSSWRTVVAWRPRPLMVAAWTTIAVVLAIASGGIWAVRNWINFGSPLAPSGFSVFGMTVFPGDSIEGGRYYLSVLRDIRDVSGYDVAARAAFFTRQWFGPWFLLLTLAAFPMVVEALALGRRRYAAERVWLFVVVVVLTLPHAALLVQAPWSSLEWTKGLALRYALPFFILWPFLAFLVMFPVSWRWSARLRPALVVGTMMAGTALVLFARNAQLPGVPPLSDTAILLISLAVSVLIVFHRNPRSGPAGRLSPIVGLTLMVALVWSLSSITTVADERLRRAAVWARDSPMECVDLRHPPAANRYAAVYAAVLKYERRIGRTCERRRFFVAARFDSPMALQPPPYTNLVYDARPRTMVKRAMATTGPGAEGCDYVIASEAELQTDRGNMLVNRLREEGSLIDVDASPPYVIFSFAERHR